MSKVTPVRGLLATALVTCAISVQADVFNMPAGKTSLQFVTVGNPGNAADTSSGYGAVPYVYQMGKYDVTVGQYVQFLNDVAASDPYGLYNSNMASIFPTFPIVRSGTSGNYSYAVTGTYGQGANCPIFDVNWGDCARFCNWLQNGQGTAANVGQAYALTETGAYALNGDTTVLSETRSVGAKYFIPSENEWYKAAYYSGGGTSSAYYTYPTRSNTVPSNVLSTTGTNNASYYAGSYTDPSNGLTPVGAFTSSPGPYGTYDMGGDVFQWNEAAFNNNTYRGFRGGAFDANSSDMISSYQPSTYPYATYFDFGFRVASSQAVPEPGSLALLLAGAVGLLGFAWRRRTHAS